jgi:hypothetical protein
MPDRASRLPLRIRFPEWQQAYEAAILEMDRIVVSNRIAEAETAILKRLEKIRLSAIHEAERQAIQNAIFMLHIVKQEEL